MLNGLIWVTSQQILIRRFAWLTLFVVPRNRNAARTPPWESLAFPKRSPRKMCILLEGSQRRQMQIFWWTGSCFQICRGGSFCSRFLSYKDDFGFFSGKERGRTEWGPTGGRDPHFLNSEQFSTLVGPALQKQARTVFEPSGDGFLRLPQRLARACQVSKQQPGPEQEDEHKQACGFPPL